MNDRVYNNLRKVDLYYLIVPLMLLFAVVAYFIANGIFTREAYVDSQNELFVLLNARLSQFPDLQYNLTQLGDSFICLSILSVFLIFAPKLWEALASGLICTAIFSLPLKRLFSVPRPSVALDLADFTIVGERVGGYHSFPSGHSMTAFTVMGVLLFAFMPKDLKYKILWTVFTLGLATLVALSRIGVGAHYPFDALTGSIIGCVCAILGIAFSNRVGFWAWIGRGKYMPVLFLMMLSSMVVMVAKIMRVNTLVFDVTLFCIVVTIILMVRKYVKERA